MAEQAVLVAALGKKSIEAQRSEDDAQKLDEALKSGTAEDVAKARAGLQAALEAKHLVDEDLANSAMDPELGRAVHACHDMAARIVKWWLN